MNKKIVVNKKINIPKININTGVNKVHKIKNKKYRKIASVSKAMHNGLNDIAKHFNKK